MPRKPDVAKTPPEKQEFVASAPSFAEAVKTLEAIAVNAGYDIDWESLRFSDTTKGLWHVKAEAKRANTPFTWAENTAPSEDQLADWLTRCTKGEAKAFVQQYTQAAKEAEECFRVNHKRLVADQERAIDDLRKRLNKQQDQIRHVVKERDDLQTRLDEYEDMTLGDDADDTGDTPPDEGIESFDPDLKLCGSEYAIKAGNLLYGNPADLLLYCNLREGHNGAHACPLHGTPVQWDDQGKNASCASVRASVDGVVMRTREGTPIVCTRPPGHQGNCSAPGGVGSREAHSWFVPIHQRTGDAGTVFRDQLLSDTKSRQPSVVRFGKVDLTPYLGDAITRDDLYWSARQAMDQQAVERARERANNPRII